MNTHGGFEMDAFAKGTMDAVREAIVGGEKAAIHKAEKADQVVTGGGNVLLEANVTWVDVNR